MEKKQVSNPVALTLFSSFIIAAVGWEIWITYGLSGGLPVSLRRSEMLNCAIPQNLNWILNSLGDVLVVWIGIFIIKKKFKDSISPFKKWNWYAFFVLLTWFILQNIYVEAFFYHLQLGKNGDLSWAPLNPLGSYYNPILFKIFDRPITFQTQSTWLLMSPIIYYLAIYLNNKYDDIKN